MATCFSAALEASADVVVTPDGDGQHNPGEIPLLSTPVIQGQADIAVGSRFLDDSCTIPLYRRFGIGVISWLYNTGARGRLRDTQSCFRAYRRDVFETLSLSGNGMSISIEALNKATRVRMPHSELKWEILYKGPRVVVLADAFFPLC